jgi:hypothetical protein
MNQIVLYDSLSRTYKPRLKDNASPDELTSIELSEIQVAHVQD